MRFKIITLGCKVNTYESEYITELLKQNNYFEVQNGADVVIINTCSVTNQADAKSRKLIRKAKKDNPKAIIVVMGCMSQNNQNIKNDLHIDILLGTKDKSKIIDYLKEYIINKQYIEKFYDVKNIEFENMTLSKYEDRTRAFVKIQDGCNNYCTYCVIPYLRGCERSKDFNSVINEINQLVANGHQEIVLTGIHTGNYKNNGKRLVDIIHEISKIDKLKRIRISSIEITEIDEDFLNELRENKKICNHLHIPLQSGSDKILKLMNRKYDTTYYYNKIKEIRNIIPNISVTTDIIVGFPGETDEDFDLLYNFAKKVNFSKIHVFPYSLRYNTVAAKMNNQVSDKDKKNRTQTLLELSINLENEYAKKFIGKELEILAEDNNHGHASNYLDIYIDEKIEKNNFYVVKILEINDKILGKINKIDF